MSRFVVLEEHQPDEVAAAVAELAARRAAETPAGRTGGTVEVVDGWHRPLAGQRTLCTGQVANPAQAAAAVLCAVSGAELVVDAVAGREVIDRLCDDLRRLGDLEHRVGRPAGNGLAAEERTLLALLLGGATLGQAARTLHLSRRTADRRLASARRALGAGSTAEAVAAAARLGVRPTTAG